MKTSSCLALMCMIGIVALGYALIPSHSVTNPITKFRTATHTSVPTNVDHIDSSPVKADSPEPNFRGETAASASDAESPFETVFGLRVRKDRNCTVEKRYISTGDGTVIEGVTCVPNSPQAPGQYDTYNDETLAQMAYSDAAAAEVLGKRLVEQDPQRAYNLLLRSVALKPKNTQPILWLAGMSYSLVSVNGEPALKQMSERYVLSRTAEELGTPGVAAHARLSLIETGMGAAEFQQLEADVRHNLQAIREVQIRVKGESNVPEVSL